KISKNIKKNYFENEKEISISKNEIQKLFEKLFEDEYFIENYFPADLIAIKRSNDSTKKIELQKSLHSKIESLKKFIVKKGIK
ncbi:MAG: hypothetical protein KBT21_03520, partial [Treponema sp.]|nr:hypothetical protein [Candidatus Treponema merdequi]